ncbi:hypothetical protein H9623_07710 [Oerskovia sp. Sa1BUA8]|uniref:Glycoprotein n=1 Tax=Oerskovia douganii TaxID=2762210 RepID=A0A9D5U959_9CELL|nr:DUF6049 family protein [Oerskovia douganii]MBE7700190.1 hypothetical protein [Oerskovia douganii]
MSSHFSGGAPRTPTRRPAPRRPFSSAGRPARGLLAALLLLGLSVVPSTALATAPTATPVSTGTSTDTHTAGSTGAVTTTLVSMTPTTVRPGDTVTVAVKVHNGTDETIDDPQATLGVSWRTMTSRSALEAWADAPTSQQSAERMAVEDLDPLGPGRDATVTFTVAADDFNLEPGSSWGPRPLSVTVTDGGERLDVLRSFFLWEESQAPLPVRVSVVAPVTGPALGLLESTADTGTEIQSTVDVRAVDEALRPDQRLSRLLAATAGDPVISWAVDPALVAAAETSSDADSVAWAAQLHDGTAGRTVFGLRPYDPDAAAYAQVGALLPAPTIPLPGAVATDPAWRTDLTYPADDVPDLATVRTSVQSGSPLVVVRGDGLTPETSVSYTPTALATVQTDAGPATALVADDTLGQVLVDATRFEPGAEEPSTADGLQRLLAETAVVASERPTDSRHVLIALPRSWDPDPGALATVLDTLGTVPWVDVAPVQDLLDSPVPDVPRTALPESSTDEDTLPASEMDALQRARTQVATFATIATDPAPIVQSAEPALVVPTAVAYRNRPDDRRKAVGTAVQDAAVIRSAVSIVPRGLDVTLINTSGNLPVWVRNTLDQPVTVQVALRPDSGLLKVVSFPVGTVAPGTETDFKVPVQAIGSGDVSVEVELLSVPAGTVVSPPSEFVVQVRAEWENTGTAIFAGLVALLLIGGIWRTIRRGRSPRRVAELTPAAGVPTARGAAAPSGTTRGDAG